MPRSGAFAFLLNVIAVTALSSVWAPAAHACGGPWDVACNVGKAIEKGVQDVGREGGRIIEQGRTDLGNGLDRIDPRINQLGRDIDRLRLELQSSVFTGPALEQWFIASRNSSINGAVPIPPDIRQAVQGWYDDDVMNRVRFKVGDGGALNLANNSIRVGSAEAVTLIDVVVFKGPTEAADPSLWVHELKHVQQFRDWGVRDFAIRYMRSWNSVEDPAYAIQAQYNNGRNQAQNQQVPGQGFPGGPAMMPASVCRVGPQPNAVCPLPWAMPVMSNCSCTNQFGQQFYGMAQ